MGNSMIERVLPQIQQVWTPIVIITAVMGVGLIISGILMLAGNGQRIGGSGSYQKVIKTILAGILLANLPSMLDSLAFTFFEKSSMQDLSYLPPESTGKLYITLAVYIIQLVGLYGVIKGLLILKNIDRNGAGYGVVAAHLIGGTWAVNFVVAMRVIGRSLGGAVLDGVSITLGL